MNLADNYPITVGVGQTVDHWDGAARETAPSPISLAVQAIDRACEDAELSKDAVETLAIIRSFSDSLPRPFDPFGKPKNLPATIVKAAGLTPHKIIYSTAGGEQPQSLVNELSEAIFLGQTKLAMIAGSEALSALKIALKNDIKLDWSSEEHAEIDDRGKQTDFISMYEVANGMGLPPQTYAAMEQALRARLKMSKAEYLNYMSRICAGLSKTAAENPYAQFPQERAVDFLSTPSRENFPVCDPYLKWHVAQDAVNQGSALILTSVGHARALGIDPAKWIYLHGYSDVKEKLVSERPDISKSKAIEVALSGAIDSTYVTKEAIVHRDIYSCFPIVVHIAAEVLGLDPAQDKMSVTGGLPFFGGAGNNYSTHAIASLAETLRSERESYGLILANGGFMSKQSAGVYSAVPPPSWRPVSSAPLQQEIDAQPAPHLLNEDCEARIEAFTVRHNRRGIDQAYIFARNEKGRVMATVPGDHRASLKALHAAEEPVGQRVKIIHKNGRNFVANPNPIGDDMPGHIFAREFEFVTLKRDAHVLEVTLNRPESYNALHSAAHFELAEIFDAFEADKELWAAIITGTGDKAFCSGNDLKVTASGGDMSTPSSGFAGLCARTDREKPVIAAVNGVAMGGGLEIVLACDIALASANATFALPEVKVGLFAAAGGVQRLTRQVGEKAAMELILTGRKIEASEAAKLGLVNTVTDGSVMEAARVLAKTITGNSPTSIRASKRVLNAVDSLGNWEKALELSNAEITKLMTTKYCREGVTAFAQKRKPKWTNE